MGFSSTGDIGGSLGIGMDIGGSMSVSGNDLSMSEAFGMSDGINDFYDGPYTVTPKIGEQYLDTDLKAMSEDVIVLPIPYVQVSNPYGQTVTIGEL